MQMMELFKLPSQPSKEDEQTRRLINEIIAAKRELTIAMDNFNYADRKDLVDLFSHQITLAQAKCDVLIKNARAYNVKCSHYLLDKTNI